MNCLAARSVNNQPQTCGRPVEDGYLCWGCTRYLERLLAELPAWLDELRTTTARLGNTTGPDGSKPSKKAAAPLPFDADGVQLEVEVREGLASWVFAGLADKSAVEAQAQAAALRVATWSLDGSDPQLLTVEAIRRQTLEGQLAQIRDGNLTAQTLATWLVRYVERIRLNETAPEMLGWLRQVMYKIREAVDNKGLRWAGPCTAVVTIEADEIDGVVTFRDVPPHECGADLRTRAGASKITCRECGAEYDPVDRAKWIIMKSREHHATASFLALALTDAGYPVRRNTISQWAKRRKLYSYRDDENGHPLYMVGDVLDLILAARRASEEATA